MKKPWFCLWTLILIIFSGYGFPDLYAQEPAPNEVILYEYKNCVGEKISIKLESGFPYWSTRVGNRLWGKVSSIRIGSDVGVYLFEDTRFFKRVRITAPTRLLAKKTLSARNLYPDNHYNAIIIFRKSFLGLVGVCISGWPKTGIFEMNLGKMDYRFMFIYPPRHNTGSYEISLDTPWDRLEFIKPKGKEHQLTATVFHGPKCTGKSVTFRSMDSMKYDLDDYGFSRKAFDYIAKKNRPRSIRITYTGPYGKKKDPLPAPKQDKFKFLPPKGKGESITSPKVRPKTSPHNLQQLRVDAITGYRLFKKAPDQLTYAVEYFIEKHHGNTVYLGGWLYDYRGQAFGGYQPTAVASPGGGSAKLTITVKDQTRQVKEIEFFLHEPGKTPFIKRRFRLQ